MQTIIAAIIIAFSISIIVVMVILFQTDSKTKGYDSQYTEDLLKLHKIQCELGNHDLAAAVRRELLNQFKK